MSQAHVPAITRKRAKWILAFVSLVTLPIAAWAQWTGSTDIYNTNSGNVGIGTSSPSATLHVHPGGGDVRIGDITAWTSTDSGIMMNGDGSYESALFTEVSGQVLSYGINVPQITTRNTGRVGGIFRLDARAASSFPDGGAFIVYAYPEGSSDAVNRFAVNLHTGTTLLAPVAGNVGIGTSSPTSKLHVDGDVTVTGDIAATGNIAAKYQDLAEWVPSRQSIPAGTVVILDPDTDNGVIASSVPYDIRVAGVISGSPGILLGEAAQGKVKVATTGRVKVRVDARERPIRRGDPLVSSSMGGAAMRSEPIQVGEALIHRPGTVIGKALEPLASGEGEILVLLSLQ